METQQLAGPVDDGGFFSVLRKRPGPLQERQMRNAFSLVASLLICLVMFMCSSAQGTSSALSISGDFGRDWIDSLNAKSSQNVSQTAAQDSGNDLWSWGSSPKGSIAVNGNLVADPYYIWKSLNYSDGWMGQMYVDPSTGYPVYGYVDPYTGMVVNYYMDPKTGKPVYTNANYLDALPYISSVLPTYPSDYSREGYVLPKIFT